MAVMNEFEKERASIKERGWVEKLQYVWDYYKWIIITVAIILAIAIYGIHAWMTHKDNIANGIFLNAYAQDDKAQESLALDFLKSQNLDSEEYKITLNSALKYIPNPEKADLSYNMNTYQALLAQSTAGELDFVTGDLATMIDFSYRELCIDLREVLSEEQIEKYEPYFYYKDQAVMDARQKLSDEGKDINTIPIPDPSKPEEMENPIPVLIDLTNCEKLDGIYTYDIDTLVFGIATKASHIDMAGAFLDYIME